MLTVQVKIPDYDIESYEVTDESFIIGRSKTARVQIKSSSISRKHLKIVRQGDVILIEDPTKDNWVSYLGQKIKKNIGVRYQEGAECILPGNIKIKFFNKEAAITQNVEEKDDKLNDILANITSGDPEAPADEIDEDEEFTGEIELELTKKKSNATRTRSLSKIMPEDTKAQRVSKKSALSLIVLCISILGIAVLMFKDN